MSKNSHLSQTRNEQRESEVRNIIHTAEISGLGAVCLTWVTCLGGAALLGWAVNKSLSTDSSLYRIKKG